MFFITFTGFELFRISNYNKIILQVIQTSTTCGRYGGTIRYSTPREQTELEWLAGDNTKHYSSPSSSASSNHSLNYWKRNSRHEEENLNVDPKNKVQTKNSSICGPCYRYSQTVRKQNMYLEYFTTLIEYARKKCWQITNNPA